MSKSKAAAAMSIEATVVQGNGLVLSAAEQESSPVQTDPVAHVDIRLRIAGADGGKMEETVGLRASTATIPVRTPQRRAILGSASPVRREPAAPAPDTLANTVGLVPRHMRRATDIQPPADQMAVAEPTTEQGPQVLWHLDEVVLGVDRTTSELRRRIFHAKSSIAAPSTWRLPPQVTCLILIGVWLGIGDLVLG
jgi:hypothetical protein